MLTSGFEKRLFNHYWDGTGTTMNLSKEDFNGLVNASKPAPKSKLESTNNGLFKQTYRTYQNEDYDQALGDYTLFKDSSGKPVGMKDTYNFNAHSFFGPDARPTVKAEVTTQLAGSAGNKYKAKEYRVQHGRTD